jgi:hypothetical protein
LRLDFPFVVKTEQRVNNASDVIVAVLLEQQLTQVKSSNCLVFIKKFDRTDLVHLPPLLHTQRITRNIHMDNKVCCVVLQCRTNVVSRNKMLKSCELIEIKWNG